MRKEAGLFLVFATLDPAAGYKGITAFLVEKGTLGFAVGARKTSWGFARRALANCSSTIAWCRRRTLLGEPGKGYKIAIETLNEGRIGIGAQMLGLAEGAWGHAARWAKERQAVWQTDRGVSGDAVPAGGDGDGDRGGAADGLQRSAAEGCGACVSERGGDGEVLRVAGSGARGEASAWRSLAATGFVRDYPVEKLYRDAKIGKIYEGTSIHAADDDWEDGDLRVLSS